MAAISAAFNDSLASPGYDLSLTTLTSNPSWTHYRVVWRDPEGRYPDQVVRGTDMIAISGATAAVSDYEFPQFRSGEYRLELYIGDTLDSTVTDSVSGDAEAYFDSQGALPLYGAWLQSVTQPSLNQACFVEKFPPWKRSGKILAKNNVLGRSKAVVVTDVMGGREGEFSFWVGDVLPPPFNETEAIEEYELLFNEGDILLFRAYNENLNGIYPLYFIVESATYDNKAKDGKLGQFNYKVNYTETDRPATGTISVSNVLWDDVSTTFTDWDEVFTNRATWFEVLQDPTL